MADEKKKITLKERKKAQPNAQVFLTEPERQLIRETVGKDLNDAQYKIFIYTCQALGLNPLMNEIAAVTYSNKSGGKDMSIQVMRDGFLTIAHRSGKFAGLESGIYEKGQTKPDGSIASERTGWAKAYHRDFMVPVYQEADFSEYNTSRNLWTSKPKTMIKKVAESMALRKAFNISGVYAPEEMDKEIQMAAPALAVPENKGEATEAQKNTIRTLIGYEKMEADDKDFSDEWIDALSFIEAASKIRELSTSPQKHAN